MSRGWVDTTTVEPTLNRGWGRVPSRSWTLTYSLKVYVGVEEPLPPPSKTSIVFVLLQ